MLLGFNLVQTLFEKLLEAMGFDISILGVLLGNAPSYMLPSLSAITSGIPLVWAGMVALGLAVGTTFFLIAVINGMYRGRPQLLIQACAGLVLCVVAGPLTLALYGALREVCVASGNWMIGASAINTWSASLNGAIAGNNLTGAATPLLAQLALLVGVVGLAVAAGVLGFGTVLMILFSPVVAAFAIFRSGTGILVKYLTGFVGVLLAPIAAGLGLAATGVLVNVAGWSWVGIITVATGILMSAAAPFLVIGRLQQFGAGVSTDHSAGPRVSGGANLARSAKGALKVVRKPI